LIINLKIFLEFLPSHPYKEVLKRLEENDLFAKPEKYKWKVREVEFLAVVIR